MRWNHRIRRGVIPAALIVASLVVLIWLKTGGTSFPPLPVPNAYDRLMAAARGIVRSTNVLARMSQAELEMLVSSNDAALKEIRAALASPCAVPVQFDQGWLRSGSHDLVRLKGAARAMDAEVFLLQTQGDIAGALDRSLDLLKFGQALARHGVLIDCLTGTSCEELGVHRLADLLERASLSDCRRVIAALEEHERSREPFQEILGHEKEWERKSYRLKERLGDFIEEQISVNPVSGLSDDPAQEYASLLRAERILLLRYAVRAFTLERRRPPGNVKELFPAFLHALPLDPVTLKPLELPIANEQ